MTTGSPRWPRSSSCPTKSVARRWRDEHAERLAFVFSRAELRSAWKQADVGRGTDRRPWGRAALAADLAAHDCRILHQEFHQAPYWDHLLFSLVMADRQAAAQRVQAVGTPTWWTGQRVDAGTPCPLRPPTSPAHRWSEMEPVCEHCTAVMATPAPIDRAVLADQVWQARMRGYGLSRQQVAGALDALGDLIDARRAPAQRRAAPRA